MPKKEAKIPLKTEAKKEITLEKTTTKIALAFLPLLLFSLIFVLQVIISSPFSRSINGVWHLSELSSKIYAPALLFFDDPFKQYMAMLVINSFLASLNTLIAYRISGVLGGFNIWKRVLISLCASITPALIAQTKMTATDTHTNGNITLSLIFPGLVLLFTLYSFRARAGVSKCFFSVVLGGICSSSILIGEGSVPTSFSLILTIILSAALFKKEIVKLVPFILSIGGFSSVFIYLLIRFDGSIVEKVTRFYPVSMDTADTNGIIVLLKQTLDKGFYLLTSTFGISAIVLCLVIKSLGLKKKEKTNKSTENGAFVVFLVFVFCSMLFSVLPLPFLSGRYSCIDGIIPIIWIASLVFVFSFDTFITLRTVLAAVVIAGSVFTAFLSLNKTSTFNPQSIPTGLYPLGIVDKVGEPIGISGIFLSICVVFCFLALVIVVVCCSNRSLGRILSKLLLVSSVYSALFIIINLLPYERDRILEKNAPVYEVAEFIHDSIDSPPVYTCSLTKGEVELLCFLKKDTGIKPLAPLAETVYPENLIIVLPRELCGIFEKSQKPQTLVGETDKYTIYALGEKAVMYTNSQKE